MSFFTMNQDAQIFNDNQESLNDQYLATQVTELPKKEDVEQINTNQATVIPTTTEDMPREKDAPRWAHPRFTMSQFQLYETKTVYQKTRI
jgi:hypothetical protein